MTGYSTEQQAGGPLEAEENGFRSLGFGYKLAMAAVCGIAVWMIVLGVSPSNLVDASDVADLPDDAQTAAIEDFEIAQSQTPVPLAADEGIPESAGTVAAGTPGAVLSVETDQNGDVVVTTEGDVTEELAAAARSSETSPSTTADASETTTPPGPAGSATGDGSNPQIATEPAPAPPSPAPAVVGSLDYQSNLELIRSSSIRNTNHDNSPYRSTASADLVLSNHFGPRSEYLNNPGDNPEQSFPVPAGGQFRVACEFSHFAYDDPLVFPGKPGAAHLHMFFGNTDVNAFSTYDTLLNSGSSTCNGQELNRTGYWVPALFDGNGNVRIPERVVVYYKGEGLARGNTIPYPAGAAMITDRDINTIPTDNGGAQGKFSFVCSDNFSGTADPQTNTMAACDGSVFKNLYGVDTNPHVVLEMNVKFPNCWNGQDPTNPDNFSLPRYSWYGSQCLGEFNRTLPNLEYFVNYKVDVGENTADWYLSSDVDPTSFGTAKATGGSSIHGDWWGAWNAEVNQMWLDNCVNFATSAASGCGFGYLSDGGPNGNAPLDGPALKVRPQYTGPNKVSAEALYNELCPNPGRSYNRPEDAAYCAPGTGL